jgi:sialic acid synthase SpsE
MRLILDLGSGASCPDAETAIRMIDEVAKRDTHKHEIIFKFQLFQKAPPNTPLGWDVFNAAYTHARNLGYALTASVFDEVSLCFLLWHNPVFVKIACRPDLYWLAGEVPRKVPVYASRERGVWIDDVDVRMDCVRKYPASFEDYAFEVYPPAVSDHTIGWELLRLWDAKVRTQIWEKHLKLPDTTGPDAGPWAVFPAELEGII